MNRKGFFVQTVLKCFAVAMCTEFVFRILSFQTVFDLALIRITLFSIAYALIIAGVCSFLPLKAGRFVSGLMNWLLPVYAIFLLGYRNLMGHYVSLKTAGQGAKVGDYIVQYMQCLKPGYFLIFAAPLAVTVYSFRHKAERERGYIGVLIFLVIALCVNLGGVATVYAADLEDLYSNPAYIAKSLQEFGLARYFVRDMTSGFREDSELVIDETEAEGEAEPEEDPNVRKIDDTAWKEARDAEEDETIRTIDSYLLSRPVSDYNDMTGYFEGKNFVYVLVESLDYMAFDEKLTPTLCKLMNEGWNFSNHYTPRYACTTGDTGFITEVSLIPDNTICTENEYMDNAWPDGIFEQFANAGYATSAFHNWWDEYYERRTYYANEGCQVYLNYDDLPFHTIAGWQSDLELMEFAVDEFIHEDKFMTAIITSSMHFPYEKYSVLGEKYLSEINKVHPDYPAAVKSYLSKTMEFDKAMEYLLDSLKKEGKLENTVIMFFNDHHPFEMDEKMIAAYSNTEYDRLEAMNIDRGPFIVYCAGESPQEFTGVNSTFDILPTMLNLFGIEYDPRLYMGADYFSDTEKIVYMPEGDWITDRGIYYMETGTFDGTPMGESYVSVISRENQNKLNISKMIYRSDYFSKREFITKPEYLNEAPAVIARRHAAAENNEINTGSE